VVFGDNVGVRAFRNIFGLDIANVNALNLLSLAPGGHLGRFLIWTKSAFAQLDKIFGTFTQESAVKHTKYKVHADGAFAKGRNELHDAITDLFDLHGQHCFDKCGDLSVTIGFGVGDGKNPETAGWVRWSWRRSWAGPRQEEMQRKALEQALAVSSQWIHVPKQ
jgi:hypothetical protein